MSTNVLPYRLLDSGNLKKLEQVGPYRLVRPALNAFWGPSLPDEEWLAADAVFTRNSDGSGNWKYSRRIPQSWLANWGNFNLIMKPTGFGHLGFFAEQYTNWEFFSSRIGKGDKALNLFGYSGVGSMAMAATGASACHLDASQGMVDWGRENLTHNPRVPSTIRWIVDDVKKFVQRELRRENSYSLIALDPPSFGRGNKGEVWKIETDLPKLLADCAVLRDKDKPFTLVLSCHSPGFSLLVLERMIREAFRVKGEFDSFEMTIPESTGRVLPAGVCVRFLAD